MPSALIIASVWSSEVTAINATIAQKANKIERRIVRRQIMCAVAVLV